MRGSLQNCGLESNGCDVLSLVYAAFRIGETCDCDLIREYLYTETRNISWRESVGCLRVLFFSIILFLLLGGRSSCCGVELMNLCIRARSHGLSWKGIEGASWSEGLNTTGGLYR